MSLSPAFLDELRARTTLSALIAPTVKLTKAGREFKACCPFHQEKTPSFTINDEKGFYHCFGCGAHGDAIRFLTDARGLPFIDAVKELAGKAGMDVPAQDPQSRERQEKSVGLYDVMAAAQRWFADQLAGIEGAAARNYLAQRGIAAAAIARFGIGFAPDSRGKLKAALAAFGEDKLVETGMLIRPEDGKATYDRFRGRVMIPIRDPRGRVIAFGGRILGQGEPKYLNSPETLLFDKGRTLYNLDLASPASRAANRVIVVEGYMDVIALDRAGISEAVAPNGTALTEGQLERLWRLDPSPVLCFDGDRAGQKAAARAALRALPFIGPQRNLSFVTLPAGRDPDDVINSGGVNLFQKLLATSSTLFNFLWNIEFENCDPERPEDRANFKYRLDTLAQTIADPIFRAEYGREFRRKFYDRFGFKKEQRETIRNVLQGTKLVCKGGGRLLIQRAVLLGLSRFPGVAGENQELVLSLRLDHTKLDIWRTVILDAVRDHPGLDEDVLQTILDSSDASPIEKRDIQRDLAFSFFKRMSDAQSAKSDLLRVMTVLVAEAEIEEALQQAHNEYRATLDNAAWNRQNALRLQKFELEQTLSEFDAALAA